MLTEEEEKEFKERIRAIGSERADVILKELQKSSEKFRQIVRDYEDGVATLLYVTGRFEPKRFTESKFVVWWDFERFIHIFMRHVQETQVGERFETKTVFQYELGNIIELTETILSQLNDEIQKHFMNNPDKEFKRIGERSFYYNGDYYAIQIAPDGRLMRFHKNN